MSGRVWMPTPGGTIMPGCQDTHLYEARDDRDRARDALALWTAGEYEAGLVVERVLEREQRALACAARVAAERDRALEILRRLAPTDPDVHAIRRSSGSGEYGAANG